MTREDKNKIVDKYCCTHDCNKCVLFSDEHAWCNEYTVKNCPEDAFNKMFEFITDTNTKTVEQSNVNHPSHYNQDGAMECIDEMILLFGKYAVMDFCMCNAWKYRYRANEKNGDEDRQKANWYLAMYKELAEGDSCK